jgi:phage terminase large subunit-like protein
MNEHKGVTAPRVYTKPLRRLTEKTSLGFAAIEYSKTVLHKELYPWQEWALIHSLEIVGNLAKDWHFRYRTVLFLISRQNGKTVLSEVIASFFLNVLQVESIFGTSLSLDKAEEVWEAVIRDQETLPELSADIDRVSGTNGNKRLILSENHQKKQIPAFSIKQC